MKRSKIIGYSLLLFALTTCFVNPITGRSSIQLMSNTNLNEMSLNQYNEVLSTSKVVSGADSERVKAVGKRIAEAVKLFYKEKGLEKQISEYNWDFNLIEDEQINAWCMPGGKVAVYTGILPVTKDDAGLAVVMGHEISHALAGHSNERISKALLSEAGKGLLTIGVIAKEAKGEDSRKLQAIEALYSIGSGVTLLAYDRRSEFEADEMGLYIMAMAGYDPRNAPDFWERMKEASGKSSVPTFLSTHPSPKRRKSVLESNMPKAMEYYREAIKRLNN